MRSFLMTTVVLASVALLFVPASAVECGTPDPSALILDDANIWHIVGGDLLTVLASPFADDSLVGEWIAVRTTIDQPIEYFQIVSNEHFLQNNTSVFTVAEDLESAGGRDWWLYFEQSTFDIVADGCAAPTTAGEEPVLVSPWGSVKTQYR